MNLKKIDKTNLNEITDQAVNLVLNSYDSVREKMKFLPQKHNYYDVVKKGITYLFSNGDGVIATENDKLLGFLYGYKVKELFGSCEGIYCPLFGHSTLKHNKRDLYELLYEKAAENWCEEKYLSHVITLFSSDEELLETWFWLGFGNRCVDSIREVSKIYVENDGIEIIKANESDIKDIENIYDRNNEYFLKSPLFMPSNNKISILDLYKWMKNKNHHLWIAYKNNEAIGYMKIQPKGESFISLHDSVMNITGAYVDEEYRNIKTGKILLSEIQKWLLKNGYKYCGVDFESFNILGSRFWNKYFTPYTFSLVRRIDERIAF